MKRLITLSSLRDNVPNEVEAIPESVIPARFKRESKVWIPAFAGMT